MGMAAMAVAIPLLGALWPLVALATALSALCCLGCNGKNLINFETESYCRPMEHHSSVEYHQAVVRVSSVAIFI